MVVCFDPELYQLKETVEAIARQVGRTVVVDNGCGDLALGWLAEQHQQGRLFHLAVGENRGVAAAHNVGIEWARKNGCTHVLLLDQDSEAAEGVVSRLMRTLVKQQLGGIKVAAVGPRVVDRVNGIEYSFLKSGLLTSRVNERQVKRHSVVAVDQIISSGTLLPISALEDVGLMDASLFIDNVDVDWCFRAISCGWSLYGDGEAVLYHVIGDRVVKIWWGRWRKIAVHSPLRLYYMTRNRCHLYRRPHVPLRWIVHDLYRLVVKFLLFSILISPRCENLQMMVRGMRDGFRQIGGPYSLPRAVRGSNALSDRPARSA